MDPGTNDMNTSARRDTGGGAITGPLDGGPATTAQGAPQPAAPPQPAYPQQGSNYASPAHQPPGHPAPTSHRGGAWPRDITGPAILILLGVLFLLTNFGFVEWNIWGQVWRLWPLVLVAIGLQMLVGRRNQAYSTGIWMLLLVGGLLFLFSGGLHIISLLVLLVIGAAIILMFTRRGAAPGRIVQIPLSVLAAGARSANVNIDYGAGELIVSSLAPGAPELAAGTLRYWEGWAEPVVLANPAGLGITLRLSQRMVGRPDSFYWPGARGGWGRTQGPMWDVHLNPGLPVDLAVKTGASKATIDMDQLQVRNFVLDGGASDTTINFPAFAGSTVARVKGGAASFTLYIPRTVGAHIRTSSGLSSIDVDPVFVRRDDGYWSQNYDSAPNKLDVSLEVGIANVKIRMK